MATTTAGRTPPHIDALASRGVRYHRVYVKSTICGASRMSSYTGRYVQAHGASWNFVPLKAGEKTIGDHLRPLGVRSVLIGKTHMKADAPGWHNWVGTTWHRSREPHRGKDIRMRIRPLRTRAAQFWFVRTRKTRHQVENSFFYSAVSAPLTLYR